MKKFIALLSVFLFLSGCNWFLGKDNVEPPSPLEAFQPTVAVKTLWSTRVGRGAKGYYLRLPPAVSEQMVFAADNKGTVAAFDRLTGRRIWQSRTRNLRISAGPAYGDGIVVVATSDAEVFAFNALNGQLLWQQAVSNETLATPTVTRGKVLVKPVDAKIFAFAVDDGQKLWQYDHDATQFRLHVDSSPVVSGHAVMAGFSDGKVVSVNAGNGRLLWQRRIVTPEGSSPIERLIDIDADLVVSNRVLFAVAYQGNLVAMDVSTGDMFWQEKLSSYSGIAVNNQSVFVSDADSELWAFNRYNGAELWYQPALRARHITGPALQDGFIVVGDGEGYVHWLTQEIGEFAARARVGGKDEIIAAPVVMNDIVYVSTASGRLVALQLRRLEPRS